MLAYIGLFCLFVCSFVYGLVYKPFELEYCVLGLGHVIGAENIIINRNDFHPKRL